MYSYVALRASMATFLREYEAEIQRPIIVYEGSYHNEFSFDIRATDAESYSISYRDANPGAEETSLETLQTEGVRIYNAAAANGGSYISDPTVTGDLYIDGAARQTQGNDRLTVGEGDQATVWSVHGDVVGPYSEVGGFPFCEVGDRQVWYYHHLRYLREPARLDFQKLFAQPIQASIDPEAIAESNERRSEQERQRFVAVCRSRGEEELDQVRVNVSSFEQQLVSYQQHVTNTRSNLHTESQKIEILEARQNGTEEEFISEWDKLSNHDAVESARFTGNYLHIHTVGLNLSDPDSGEECYLGKMKISIAIRNRRITISNKDNKRRDRDHPHIQNGAPCFGAIQDNVDNLLITGKYLILFELLLGYLCSFNKADDWGRFGRLFFVEVEGDPRNNEAPAAA